MRQFLQILGLILAADFTMLSGDDSDARPPVSKIDLQIIKKAQKILNSQSKWNRNDNRVCPPEAKTFSLYCALEMATQQVAGNFKHRGAVMQEARFLIEELSAAAKGYEHRLMDDNNSPDTKFTDIQNVLRQLEVKDSRSAERW